MVKRRRLPDPAYIPTSPREAKEAALYWFAAAKKKISMGACIYAHWNYAEASRVMGQMIARGWDHSKDYDDVLVREAGNVTDKFRRACLRPDSLATRIRAKFVKTRS